MCHTDLAEKFFYQHTPHVQLEVRCRCKCLIRKLPQAPTHQQRCSLAPPRAELLRPFASGARPVSGWTGARRADSSSARRDGASLFWGAQGDTGHIGALLFIRSMLNLRPETDPKSFVVDAHGNGLCCKLRQRSNL